MFSFGGVGAKYKDVQTQLDVEALAERVNVNLESQGQRISCASLPLGQVALVDASSTDPTGDLGDLTADVAGSSATG